MSELATFKSIHYIFQWKNKRYLVYIDCSCSHGLSEFRILKLLEHWLNLYSVKEELLYWWSLVTSFQTTYRYFSLIIFNNEGWAALRFSDVTGKIKRVKCSKWNMKWSKRNDQRGPLTPRLWQFIVSNEREEKLLFERITA